MAVTNDLVTDRRVQRHVGALREAGYEVDAVGRADIRTRHTRGWRFYLEYNMALGRKVVSMQPDVVWANDTDTLPGCYVAARRLNKPLVMDAHELFPEVPEIQHKPLVKWVWRTIERQLMPKCDSLLTVCNSIADYYKRTLGVEMTVVRNLSRSQTFNRLPQDYDMPKYSTLLYQGCVNLGRGVDWAIDALEFLPECHLVVAGDGDLLEQMKAYAGQKPWKERVHFLGRMKPEELDLLTSKADVGLVMLEDMGLSYHYALPNRVGDFVAAGVPMVVSDLPEMAAVVRQYGVGEVMCEPGARALAESVKKVLAKGKDNYDFTAACADMDWNKEKEKLLRVLSCVR